jgi:hypothetical protein
MKTIRCASIAGIAIIAIAAAEFALKAQMPNEQPMLTLSVGFLISFSFAM